MPKGLCGVCAPEGVPVRWPGAVDPLGFKASRDAHAAPLRSTPPCCAAVTDGYIAVQCVGRQDGMRVVYRVQDGGIRCCASLCKGGCQLPSVPLPPLQAVASGTPQVAIDIAG